MTQFFVGFAIYWAVGIALALAVARWQGRNVKARAALAGRPPEYVAGWFLATGLFVIPALLLRALVLPLVGFGRAAQWWLGPQAAEEAKAEGTSALPVERHQKTKPIPGRPGDVYLGGTGKRRRPN